mgnify:CR=1 FL=1
MHSYTFKVSIRAHHPNADLAFLSQLFAMDPSILWVAGEPCISHKPTSRPRPESLWVASLTEDEVSSSVCALEDILERALEKLSEQAASLTPFSASGGRWDIYISLSGARNFGVILRPELLSRFSALNVELQLDIFPEAPEGRGPFSERRRGAAIRRGA